MNGSPKWKIAIYLRETECKGNYPYKRAKMIADALPTHIEKIFITCKKEMPISTSHKTILIRSESELIPLLKDLKPQLLLRDSGDTTKEEVRELQKIIPSMIHFDDFGEGGFYVNLVLQTLYKENSETLPEHYIVGHEAYVAEPTLQDVQHFGLQRALNAPLPHLVLFFGHRDNDNLTFRALRHLLQLQIPLNVTILIGQDYKHSVDELKIMALRKRNTFIREAPKNLAAFLATADIVICSGAYLPYEVASIGIPAIFLGQNEFETTLAFPSERHGFIHLGTGRKVKQSSLLNAIMELLLHKNLRKQAIQKQTSLAIGQDNHKIIEAILYFIEYPSTIERNSSYLTDINAL